jgi:DNA-binding winged helix-turn-helix (wHTH) protein
LIRETIAFPPFLLDLESGRLLRGDLAIHLRPRTWAVLRYLALSPGRLVTKDELLSAVWSDAVVSEGTLTNSIRELRAALDDDARAPRFLETVHRRGFRFLAGAADERRTAAGQSDFVDLPSPISAMPSPVSLVGREEVLESLRSIAAEAAGGATRVALISGEAGIGKSSVVTRLVAAARAGDGMPVMHTAIGRSVGYLHGAPPYLPFLSAIESLATGSESDSVLEALRANVPDLLQQMPWLFDGEIAGCADASRKELAPRLTAMFAELGRRISLMIVLEIFTTPTHRPSTYSRQS